MQFSPATALPTHSRRGLSVVLGATLLLGMGLSPVAPPAHAAGPEGTAAELEITGTIVLYLGQEGHPEHTGDVIAEHLPDEVRLVTASGESVAITGPGTDGLSAGSTVTAVLELPATLEAGRALDGPASIDADSTPGQQLVAEANALGIPLEASHIEIIAQAPLAAATAVLPHTVDVAIVYDSAQPASQAITDDEVGALVTQLSGYWNAQTDGHIPRVTRNTEIKRVTISNPCSAQATWAATAPLFGTTVNKYQFGATPGRHLLVLAPSCTPGNGLGSVGSLHQGGVTWSGYNDMYGPVTVAHEMGHNLGLGHSNSLDCVNPIVLSEYNVVGGQLDKCDTNVYNDLYDIMGAGTPNTGTLQALNVSHRYALGVLSNAALPAFSPTLNARNTQTEYTINHVSGTSGQRGVMVTDPRTSERYFVEYRSGLGTDAGTFYAQGYSRYLRFAPGVRVTQLRGIMSAVFSRPTSTAPSTSIPTDRPYSLRANQSMTIRPGLTVSVRAISGSTATVRLGYSGELLPIRTDIPVITGGTRVGQELLVAARNETWGPRDLGFNYQWLRNGKPIQGEDWPYYELAEADRGARISVVVTGSMNGYTSASRTSAQTSPVTPLPAPPAPPKPVPTATPKPTAAPKPPAKPKPWPPSVSRVSGSDRFDTAVKLSRAGFSGKAPVVYLATGLDYPDALAAAPAAAKQGGPLLLTLPGKLPQVVKDEIKRLKPARVVVVGGRNAVSENVLAQVRSLSSATIVSRVAGADRFETASKIVAQAFTGTVGTAYIATGRNYPDALSASAAAGARGVPVILVDGASGVAHPTTLALLKKLKVSSLEVAGGPAAISPGHYSSLRSSVKSIARRSGADRFETSQAINKAAFGTSMNGAYLATGYQFPDALAGAVLAGATKSPLYIVQPHCVPPGVHNALTQAKPATVTVIGGTAALNATVAKLGRC